MKCLTFRVGNRFLPAAAMAVAVLASTPTLRAENHNPGVVPIHSLAAGRAYGELTVAWWRWALSAPAGQNPWFDDTTGQFADVGQSGPVWFLGASLGNSVDRAFSMPAGKFVFLPINPWIFGATVGDCGASNPSVSCDVPTLRQSAAAAATSVQALQVSIDGLSVANVAAYRAFSPGGFPVTLPNGNVLGLPPGTYAPQVSDGHWLLLAPLRPGLHHIIVHVVPDSGFGSEFTVTYQITVRGSEHCR